MFGKFTMVLPVAQSRLADLSIRDAFVLASHSLQMQVNCIVSSTDATYATHDTATLNSLHDMQGQYVRLFHTYTLPKKRASFIKLQTLKKTSFLASVTFGDNMSLDYAYADGTAERTLLYQIDKMRELWEASPRHTLGYNFSETDNLDLLLKDKESVSALWHEHVTQWAKERRLYSNSSN